MKKYLLILAAFLLVACGGTETEPKPVPEEPKSEDKVSLEDKKPEVPAAKDIKPKSKDAKASREEIQATDAPKKGLGPTDTVRAFNDAVLRKDAKRIREFLSEASLRSVEKAAKENNMTVEQILTDDGEGPMPEEREMKNEKIEGDRAVVQVKNTVLGSFDDFHLVLEDGYWRVDLVTMQKEAIRKLNELQKKFPIQNN